MNFPTRLLMCLLFSAGTAQATRIETDGYAYHVDVRPSFVQPHEPATEWPRDAPDSDIWRNWLYDQQIDHRDDQTVAYTDSVFEPRNAEAIGHAGQIEISFDPSYQSLHLHALDIYRDGRWQSRLAEQKVTLSRREMDYEERMFNGLVSALIVIADVRVGDRIRYAYSLRGRHPIVAARYLNRFDLAWNSPVLARHVRILADSNPGLNFALEHSTRQPQLRENGNMVELIWSDTNVAALSPQDAAPRSFVQMPQLLVAQRQTWSDIAGIAGELFETGSKHALVDAQVAKITSQHPSVEARALAALRFVQDEIRYFGTEIGVSTHVPAAPQLVLERRFGDCKDKSNTLVAMLRALGVEAWPALVSAQFGASIERAPPAVGAFDHAIVHFQLGGKSYWADPTMTGQRGDLAHASVPPYERALVVRDGERQLAEIDVHTGASDGIEVREHLTTPGEQMGSRASLSTVMVWRGNYADNLRRMQASLGSVEFAKAWQETLSQPYGPLDVKEPLRLIDDVDNNVLTLELSHHVQNFWKRDADSGWAADTAAYPIAFLLQLPTTVGRRAPIAVPQSATVKYEMVVEAPLPIRPAGNDSSLTAAAFDYRRTVQYGDGKLTLRHEFSTKVDQVEAADANRYRSDLDQVNNLGSLRLLIAGKAMSRSERAARLRALIRGEGQ